jgi:hypothetical protein
MIKRNLAIFLALLVLVLPLRAEDENKGGEEVKPVPLLKVIPGAYQLKSGKILKGTLLLGAFCVAVAGAVIENHKGDKSYNDYLNSMDVNEVVLLRRETEDHYRARNYYIGGMLAVFLLHVLDLKFSRGKKGIQSELSKDHFAVGVYYSF